MIRMRMLRFSVPGIVNYVYVIIDSESGKAAVIDPAWNLKEIEQCLLQENVILDSVLITHSHLDHVNLAKKIARKYNVPVYISKAESEYYHFQCPNQQCFEDGEVIHLGKSTIQCIVTPGHTKGGTCYYIDSYLFTGDTIFIEGVGLCQFEGGDAREMFESVQKIESMIPDDTLVYPGHRYVAELGQTMGYVKNNNIYFCFEDEQKFVQFRNRKNVRNKFSFR